MIAINVHLKHPIKNPTDLIRFDWEKQEAKVVKLTGAQFLKLVK